MSLKNLAIGGDRPEKSDQKICPCHLLSHVIPCFPRWSDHCWRTAAKTVSQMHAQVLLQYPPALLYTMSAGSDEDEAPGFARRGVSLSIGMGLKWVGELLKQTGHRWLSKTSAWSGQNGEMPDPSTNPMFPMQLAGQRLLCPQKARRAQSGLTTSCRSCQRLSRHLISFNNWSWYPLVLQIYHWSTICDLQMSTLLRTTGVCVAFYRMLKARREEIRESLIQESLIHL